MESCASQTSSAIQHSRVKQEMSTITFENNSLRSVMSKKESGNRDVPNPWPYLGRFFKFLGPKRNNANLEFQCLLCKPVFHKLSTSNKSHNNLKKHIIRKHGPILWQYQECIDDWVLARKQRKKTYSLYQQEKGKLKAQVDSGKGKANGDCKVKKNVHARKVSKMICYKMIKW